MATKSAMMVNGAVRPEASALFRCQFERKMQMSGGECSLFVSPATEPALYITGQASSVELKAFEGEEASPLEMLKSVVNSYVTLARRTPDCGALLFSDPEPGQAGQSESSRAFEIISAHVRAAQQAGALDRGDPELIATLIIGTIVGASDLSQNGRVRAASGVADLLSLPLFLIDRLTTKRSN